MRLEMLPILLAARGRHIHDMLLKCLSISLLESNLQPEDLRVLREACRLPSCELSVDVITVEPRTTYPQEQRRASQTALQDPSQPAESQ